MCDILGLNIDQNQGESTPLSDASGMPGRFLLYLKLIVQKKTHCCPGFSQRAWVIFVKPPSIVPPISTFLRLSWQTLSNAFLKSMKLW